MINVSVNFKNETLDVTGDYFPRDPGTYLTPPEPEEFNLVEVKLFNLNVTNLLEDYIDDIEELVLEELNR